ncbi:MAG: signal peptidase I [Herbiconiux sp.]|nr:signal peptidase I [Herbiconiux sp.]
MTADTVVARHRTDTAPKGLRHYLGLTLSAALLVLVLALAVITILLPALVGGRPLTVLTQSMEPGLPPGTLIVIRPEPVADIRLGDVLTYQLESGKPAVVSHRVIEKTFSTDGSTTFVTKGDNNDLADEAPVQEVQVVGTLWYSVPLLGWVNNAVNGDARAVIVPVAATLLFGYAGWMVFSALREARAKRTGRASAGRRARGRRAHRA